MKCGIGFVLTGDGIVGIDLDDCRDPSNGAIKNWAKEVIDYLPTYSEVSPSGTGVKLFVRGVLPEKFNKRYVRPDGDGEVEIYREGRYFTVTGQRVHGTPDDVCEQPDELLTALKFFQSWKPERKSVADENHSRQKSDNRGFTDDDQVTARAALAVLDPSMHRAEWITVGMALHSVDPSSTMLAEWDRWSAGSKVKHVEGDCGKQWETFTGDGVTIGTLCYMADQTGREWRRHSSWQAGILTVVPPSDETTNLNIESWPAPIDPSAFYGVAGDIVRKIEPHTEADPVAILIQVLVAVGNVIGRSAYFQIEATRHYANLFSVIVGASSVARKGTSGDQVCRIVRQVDEEWFAKRTVSGLVSGEGLIWQVRDPIIKQEAIREGGKKDGKLIGYQDVVADPGVDDKRLLVLESEFSAVLKAKSREMNTLSEVLRQAWDSGRLRTAAKNQPAEATGSHVSLVGHITAAELREVASQTDMVNGLANRFLWCCVKRSKLLPDGGQVHLVDFDLEIAKLKEAVEFASVEREVSRDAAAAAEWHRLYPSLSAERPGAVGAICNRGAAQVVRLSLLYAVLDCSPEVKVEHLHAALALWNYCEASVRYIFGNSLANRTADSILNALKCAGDAGVSRSGISHLFGKNKSKAELDAALQMLFSSKLARWDKIPTGGRSVEMWYATA